MKLHIHVHDARYVDRGAGIAFVTDDDRVLLLKRTDEGGCWCLPGGHVDEGETTEACARREAREELRYLPRGAMHPAYVHSQDDWSFTVFRMECDEFAPTLNGEHSGYAWVKFDQLPSPLRAGVRETVNKLKGQ